MNKYRILRTWMKGGPAVGDVLEQYMGHDYGLVRDDSRHYEEPCIALASGRESPLFYVFPLSYLERAQDAGRAREETYA